jgi:hypothetical protein
MTSWEQNGLFAKRARWLPALRNVSVPSVMKGYMPEIGLYPRGVPLEVFSSHTSLPVRQSYHLLFRKEGSVSSYLDSMRNGYSQAMRSGLESSVRSRRKHVSDSDLVLMAHHLISNKVPLDHERFMLLLDNQTVQEVDVQKSIATLSRSSPD